MTEKIQISWLQRRFLKKHIKKTRKIIASVIKDTEKEWKERQQSENAIIELQEVININDDKTDKPITKSDLKKMTNKEIVDILEEALLLVEKLL